ncbi:hypothetical protein HDU76_003373 [Blyttiomyces sp. JEL0837]|nr:hypothetical protein HDU76_003373 [Blyttiomyces sp. JEL0837]
MSRRQNNNDYIDPRDQGGRYQDSRQGGSSSGYDRRYDDRGYGNQGGQQAGYGGGNGGGRSQYDNYNNNNNNGRYEDDRYRNGGGNGYRNDGYRNDNNGNGYRNDGNARYNQQPSYGGSSNNNYNTNASGSGGGGGGGKWAAAAAAAEEQNRSGSYKPYDGWENVDDEEENYEDEGWLARKTRATQNQSVETTRKALAKMTEAEDIASSSMVKLNNQSEQLYNIEHRLNVAHGHAKISEAKASELRSLNRFFMLPTFGAKAKAKRIETKMQQELIDAEDREAERKARMNDVMAMSQDRSGAYDGASSSSSSSRSGYGRSNSRGAQPQQPPQSNNTYSTPAGLERDELEEEIDSNLDQMSAGLRRLKMMGEVMNQELTNQNQHINRIGDKSAEVTATIDGVNRNVKRVMKKK